MKTDFFKSEIQRLVKHFGPANFSSEKQKLIWSEVRDLPDKDFKIIVDLCIGEFNVEYPPKVSNFREFAIQRRKLNFRQIEESKNWKAQAQGREAKGDLDKILQDLGAKSLLEAITKVRGQNG